MNVIKMQRDGLLTLHNRGREFVVRVVEIHTGSVEIGIDHDESVRIAMEPSEDEAEVKLAVYPR